MICLFFIFWLVLCPVPDKSRVKQHKPQVHATPFPSPNP